MFVPLALQHRPNLPGTPDLAGSAKNKM